MVGSTSNLNLYADVQKKENTGTKRPVLTIAIIAGLSIFFVVWFYPSLVLLIKYPSVDITGTIDYTGLPEPESSEYHGFRFLFIPDESERSKLSVDSRFDLLTLWPNNLDPSLDNKIVRIRGTFIEDYSQYLRDIFLGRGLSTSPVGPVIKITNIQVLD